MKTLIERLRKLSAENPSPRNCIDEAADELERLTAELAERTVEKEKAYNTLMDSLQETKKQLAEARDLAEHWAILAEQRRVELAEAKKSVRQLSAIIMCSHPEGSAKYEFAYVTKAVTDGPEFCESLDKAMEAKP